MTITFILATREISARTLFNASRGMYSSTCDTNTRSKKSSSNGSLSRGACCMTVIFLDSCVRSSGQFSSSGNRLDSTPYALMPNDRRVLTTSHPPAPRSSTRSNVRVRNTLGMACATGQPRHLNTPKRFSR